MWCHKDAREEGRGGKTHKYKAICEKQIFYPILKANHFPKLNCQPDAEVTRLEPGFSPLCPSVQGTAGDKGEGACKGSSAMTPSTVNFSNSVNFPGRTNPGCHGQ